MSKPTIAALLLPLILIMSGLACGGPNLISATGTVMPEIGGSLQDTGFLFIWAIGFRDEETAMSLLTTRTQLAVVQYCKNGRLLACFENAHFHDWSTPGNPNAAFNPNFSNGSTAVYSIFSPTEEHEAMWIVLEIVDENGKWRVDSWRGLICSRATEGEILYKLFDGTDNTNLFPPEE